MHGFGVGGLAFGLSFPLAGSFQGKAMKVPSRFPKDEQLQASTGSLQILQRGWGCRMLRGLEPLLENRPAVLAFLHRKKQSSGGPPALPGPAAPSAISQPRRQEGRAVAV